MRISFRTKLITLITISIIIVFLIVGITFSINRGNELKREIISQAVMYVQLTNDKIGDAFAHYYKSGFFKFREILLHQIKFSPDLNKIQIVGLNGVVYFDSKKISEGSFIVPGADECTKDSFILSNIKKMEPRQKFDDKFRVIAPYIDEYGVHNCSIVYFFSPRRIEEGLAIIYRNVVGLCIGVIFLGLLISTIFANSITNNLFHLTNAAKKVATGDFSQSIDIKTNDEFGELAKVFNYMTSEIRHDIRKLKNMINELKRKDAEKTQFIANLSHELRTPLTSALGYVDYMEKGKLGPLTKEQTHGLTIIKRNLKRLINEICALLQISKYSLEGVKLNPALVKISEVIEPIIMDLKPQLDIKDIKIRSEFQSGLDSIYADKEQLKVVFENIINNAIKFSPPGGEIKIGIQKYSEDDKDYAQLEISDQGIGIPQKKLAKVFEPFYQVDSSTKRRYGGIGLGLSIVQNIVKAHKGQIWAERNSDGGTTFKFIIPNRGENAKK